MQRDILQPPQSRPTLVQAADYSHVSYIALSGPVSVLASDDKPRKFGIKVWLLYPVDTDGTERPQTKTVFSLKPQRLNYSSTNQLHD